MARPYWIVRLCRLPVQDRAIAIQVKRFRLYQQHGSQGKRCVV
ncbi:hypothetical protein [Oculatella sp. LEGE 06141]|nr:hypothetical protein [Oculatella sp. LEGE 06141]